MSKPDDSIQKCFIETIELLVETSEIADEAWPRLTYLAGRLAEATEISSDDIERFVKKIKSAQTKNAREMREGQARERRDLVQQKYKELKESEPGISKDEASWKIAEMQGISLAQGTVRRELQEKKSDAT